MNLFSQQQFQFNDHCHDPSECVVSNSIPVSLLFLHSAFFCRTRVARGANLTGNFERNFSTLISPWLSLASYIWAVDATRHGLEDLGKDDAGEKVDLGKQPHACSHAPCPSSFRALFFPSSYRTFPFAILIGRWQRRVFSWNHSVWIKLMCQTRDARYVDLRMLLKPTFASLNLRDPACFAIFADFTNRKSSHPFNLLYKIIFHAICSVLSLLFVFLVHCNVEFRLINFSNLAKYIKYFLSSSLHRQH